jgi:ubiquinone/menaquinone biosynthesis C-methylase UbiE
MFSKSAELYDEIYAAVGKDYPAEAEKVHKYIQQHKQAGGNRLLDVACGTGMHANLLSQFYEVEGLDLDAKMLSVCRKKYPAIRFHHGDMLDFELKHQFDAIVCLFSSIGYVKTKSRLHKTIKNMARHLVAGGVLIVEPWFTPDQWHLGRVSTTTVEKPELKIVRMSRGSRRGNISILEFQYLIGRSKGIEHCLEIHEMGLFTHEEYLDAFQSAGLKTTHDVVGLNGRGLYIGLKPPRMDLEVILN